MFRQPKTNLASVERLQHYTLVIEGCHHQIISGFALALVPLLGVIGWPVMLAGLIMGIIGAAKKW
ncbi:hypothetical protein QBL02_04915 [Leucobacter sp. UT-8R-CII-1-4]|uniref:hypothetical protein n=1 Tax=Leucobacter sp. UT-8R-CII-1-4 TaxID=3040075 RepID=UPI0024A95B47|nr:hypothetical protein [Leucobacter sp. UT-8R-CII-1-4]MDI6022881.1 hypothetical protein [Leucobacter sp. UT-8R-CII-1-4]